MGREPMSSHFFVYDRKDTRVAKRRKKYTIFSFAFDLFMIAITAGLWLIWIFVREMRNR